MGPGRDIFLLFQLVLIFLGTEVKIIAYVEFINRINSFLGLEFL